MEQKIFADVNDFKSSLEDKSHLSTHKHTKKQSTVNHKMWLGGPGDPGVSPSSTSNVLCVPGQVPSLLCASVPHWQVGARVVVILNKAHKALSFVTSSLHFTYIRSISTQANVFLKQFKGPCYFLSKGQTVLV